MVGREGPRQGGRDGKGGGGKIFEGPQIGRGHGGYYRVTRWLGNLTDVTYAQIDGEVDSTRPCNSRNGSNSSHGQTREG